MVGTLNYLTITRSDLSFSVNFSSLHVIIIGMSLFEFYGISRKLQEKVYLMKIKVIHKLLGTQMLIRQIRHQTDDLLLGIMFLLKEISYHGRVRSKMLWSDQAQNQNFGQPYLRHIFF